MMVLAHHAGGAGLGPATLDRGDARGDGRDHPQVLTDAGIRTLTWDHPLSEPTRSSTPQAQPLIERLDQLYPQPPGGY